MIKSQFKLVSADDKTIKRDEFLKVMKGCKQNPAQEDIDLAIREFKFETKTTLSYDETYQIAKHLWVQNQQNQKKLTQQEKDRKAFPKINYLKRKIN